MEETLGFHSSLCHRVAHLPGLARVLERGGLFSGGGGGGSEQLSGVPIISPLTSEVREVGGDRNRWLLTRLAWTSPDTKTLRIWK